MSSRASRRRTVILVATALGLTLAACGGNGGGETAAEGDTGEGQDACNGYPSEAISYLVPYSAGGGFDAWARLMAPYMEDELGVPVRVENVDGGGGMRAMNQIFAAPPDGTSLVFTEPGFGAVNQLLGMTSDDFDIREFTYLGQVTVDPQIFAVPSSSDIERISDLSGTSVKHAGQDVSPIESITYDTFDIQAEYILHEATTDAFLALQRGDLDITVTSLSSIIDYLEPTGDLKPILFIGTEEIDENLLGYESLQGVETITEAGHPELGEALEQYRVVAAPPGLPECMVDILSSAVTATLENPEFVSAAEDAKLRVIPDNAANTQQRVTETFATFEGYSDAIKRAIEGS